MSQVLVRDYAKWLAVFIAYPIAGALGRLIANPAHGLIFAFFTAAVAGAVLGLAQWLALGREVSVTWPVVGVSGALVAQALTGVVLMRVRRRQAQPAVA
jgi:hypothetical protein